MAYVVIDQPARGKLIADIAHIAEQHLIGATVPIEPPRMHGEEMTGDQIDPVKRARCASLQIGCLISCHLALR